jgi:CO/xanthine dehydrogenase Mo-binding subunit
MAAAIAIQALVLAGVLVAAVNARWAAQQSEATRHRQIHLQAAVENLGTIDPAKHKEEE